MIPTPELRRDADEFVEAIASAFDCASVGDSVGAKQALLPISGKVWPGMPAWQKPTRTSDGASSSSGPGGRTFTKQRAADTFARDHFQCHYCGQRLLAVSMMAALSAAFPEELPYVHTYKAGAIHSAYWLVGAEADHLVPGSRGGDWIDPANHVAACVFCNSRKSDYTTEELSVDPHPHCDESWSGRIEKYRDVWEFAARPNPNYHLQWIAAFERAGGVTEIQQSRPPGGGVTTASPDTVHSDPTVTRTRASGWNIETILEMLTKRSEATGQFAARLVQWVDASENLAGEVRDTKSLGVFRVYGRGRGQSAIFSLKTSATVEILFDSLKHQRPFTDPEIRDEMRERLNRIDGVDIPGSSLDAWPTFPLVAIQDESSFESFRETIDWCARKLVQSSEESSPI